MRSFEQREFLPLFPREDDHKIESEKSGSASEMSDAVLKLAKSVEILANAILQTGPSGMHLEHSRRTALVRAGVVVHSLELDE